MDKVKAQTSRFHSMTNKYETPSGTAGTCEWTKSRRITFWPGPDMCKKENSSNIVVCY
jgi:hypothetical protein